MSDDTKSEGRVMWTRELERLPVILGDHKIFPEDEPVHIFTPSELSALKEEVAREAFEAARQFVPHIVQDECFGPMEMMRHKYPTAKEWWAQREKGEGHE